MRVFQINTVYGTGSTGRIARQLKNCIEFQNGECMVAYGRGYTEEANTYRIGSDAECCAHALWSRITDKTGFFSKSSTDRLIDRIKEFEPDIIHLHNLHGYYIHIRVLFEFLKEYSKPVVWTLHDCWPFTGHCAYYLAADCDKWKEQCHHCINRKEYPASLFADSSLSNYQEKKELFNGLNEMVIVTPSKWLGQQVKESFLRKYPVRVIPNGVDINEFSFVRGDIRKKYSLPDKKIILGVAGVWSERKGLKDFIKLVKLLDNKYIIVLVGISKQQMKSLPKNIIGIRKTENIRELAELYSIAAVFVNPTYEDNFPTVNLEALACGTPVVTYKTGGSPETLDEHTGICVDAGDVEGLRDAIEEAQMLSREACTNRSKLFDREFRYAQYLRLYEELLSADRRI